MNALLIWPDFPDDLMWNMNHILRLLGKKACHPPLGLITVAALLPTDWQKRLIDMNIANVSENDVAWADIVFISASSVQKERTRSLISRCKQAGLKVVLGGPLVNSEPDNFKEADHLILCEGEITLPPFLKDLENGHPKHIYTTQQYADLKCSPTPLWNLLDLDQYGYMNVQSSRGCPFDCEFCNVSALLGRRHRTKASEQVIAELDGLYRLGWRGPVFFADDNFIGNKKYVKSDLLPALIKWREGKQGNPFQTEGSIDLADDPQLMKMLVDAGFDGFAVGVETVNEASLSEAGKLPNINRELVKSVKRMHHFGLSVVGSFIVGFDNDTPEIFQRQIDFIQESGIVIAKICLLTAIEGTRLYDRLKADNRVTGQEVLDRASGETNIIPKMGLEELQKGFREMVKRLYSPKEYCERVRNYIEEVRISPKNRRYTSMFGILRPIRVLIHMAFLESGKAHYMRLFIWTIRHRPELSMTVLWLVILGYQFRKYTVSRILKNQPEQKLGKHPREDYELPCGQST
jgi:radical SAM superfamily enzyme YgiQ (UPF0313 family)